MHFWDLLTRLEQRPELVTAEAQISHATRKKANSANMMVQVAKDIEKKQEKIASYHGGLGLARQEADRVQGGFSFPIISFPL